MTKDTQKTEVTFRYFKGELIAIFPAELGTNDPQTCSCYAHVGQHSSCDSAILGIGTAAISGAHSTIFSQGTMLAIPGVTDLISELQSIGYNLLIIPGTLDRSQRVAFMQRRSKQL